MFVVLFNGLDYCVLFIWLLIKHTIVQNLCTYIEYWKMFHIVYTIYSVAINLKKGVNVCHSKTINGLQSTFSQ